MRKLTLSLAFADNPRVRPLLDGRVSVDGIEFVHSRSGMPELAWRQLHGHEFDVSEISMSSLTAARSKGDDYFVGIPVFATRSFFHTGVTVNAGAGIEQPHRLVGKRIGVPEYQQTAALWARGVLQHEFGVDPLRCHWYMERLPEESHAGATGFQPPVGLDFHYIPSEKSISDMLLLGELDASLLGGRGRSSASPRLLVNERRGSPLGEAPQLKRLFPDPLAEGQRYFAKTGIFPVNHGVCIRSALLEKHPWVALNVYKGFVQAKEIWARELRDGFAAYRDTGLVGEAAVALLDVDLFPYGVKRNETLLETLFAFSYEQGLSARRMRPNDVFYELCLAL